jgi:hypothetical protein
MDFDNLHSVTSSVSDTLPFEAISIMGRDCFWDDGGRAQVCTGSMEGPGKQYPYEKTGGLEPGRFKPIEEPGVEEKDPVVFTGLETVWVYPPLVLTELRGN